MNSPSHKTIMSSGSTLPLNRDFEGPGRERRKRVRHRAQSPAFAGMNGNSTGIVLDLHQIIDLSEDGMSFQSSSPMEVGETLEFSVDLSHPKTYFHTLGRLVWSNATGRTGIRFQKTAPQDAVVLHEWLFANAIAGADPKAEDSGTIEAPAAIDSLPPTPRPVSPNNHSPSPFRSYVSALLAGEAVKQEVESLAFDLDSALQIVVQRALALTRATGAAIALSDGDEMVCRATSGPDAPPVGARLQIGSGFSGACVRLGQLLHCDDSELDQRVDRESCRALGIRSIMAAPIRSSDAVLGLIEIFSPEPGTFSDSDRAVLQTMAEIVLQSVHRAIQAVAAGKPLSPLTAPSQLKPDAHLESSRLATDELVQSMATSALAPIEEKRPPETVVAPKSRRLAWILGIAMVTAVVAVLWVMFLGWRQGLQAPKPQPRFSEQSSDLNRQAALEGNKLQDLKGLATQGDTLAEFTLGLRYATGSDAPQDYAEAAHWFSLAAARGHVLAQSTLVAYYWAGRGVPQDFKKAYYWALLAQSAGDDASRSRLPFLASRLDHADIVAVQRQADEWIKQHHLQDKPSAGRK